jgi:hypothetical protein
MAFEAFRGWADAQLLAPQDLGSTAVVKPVYVPFWNISLTSVASFSAKIKTSQGWKKAQVQDLRNDYPDNTEHALICASSCFSESSHALKVSGISFVSQPYRLSLLQGKELENWNVDAPSAVRKRVEWIKVLELEKAADAFKKYTRAEQVSEIEMTGFEVRSRTNRVYLPAYVFSVNQKNVVVSGWDSSKVSGDYIYSPYKVGFLTSVPSFVLLSILVQQNVLNVALGPLLLSAMIPGLVAASFVHRKSWLGRKERKNQTQSSERKSSRQKDSKINERSREAVTRQNRPLYATLGVQPEATVEEISAAFRSLALMHHPDLQSTVDVKEREETSRKFREILRAYHILRDPVKRETYDREDKI